jgi:hypothetical protein
MTTRGQPCLSSEHFDVAQHRPVEPSKGCFFVPVLNHVLTIGQDLFSIKTKKVKRRLIQMREKLIKILSTNDLKSTISPSLSEDIVMKSVGRS